MNNHKLKKNISHHDSRSSIKQEEIKFFKHIEAKRKTLPKKKDELKKMIEEYGTYTETYHTRDLKSKIDILKKEILDIENNKEAIEYDMNMAKFIEETELLKNREDINDEVRQNNAFFKKTSSTSAGEKYEKYMEICFGHYSKDDNNKGRNITLECKYCSGVSLILESSSASAICPECGISISFQDESHNPEFREGVHIISPYAYKRINHFKEWLAQLQAKESTEIPEDVFNNIFTELNKRRIKDSNKITSQLIRNILKNLRFNKYYEHIPTIIQKITGRRAPSLSRDLETRLVNMFREIQEPFAKHVKIVAPQRKNFLSYSYTLNKMCELLGETDLIQYFPLLKSREKNYVQDQIWKGICNDLNWEFKRSV